MACAPDGAGPDLAQAVMADLPVLDEVLESCRDVLDRDFGVLAVLIDQLDVVDPEIAQTVVDDLPDVFGTAVAPEVRPDAKLRGQDHLVAEALYGTAQDPLVGAPAVELGSVEEGDAQVVCAPTGRHAFVLVAAAIEHADTHGSVSQLGNR